MRSRSVSSWAAPIDYPERDDSQIAVITDAILEDEYIDLEFDFLHPAERPFQLVRFGLLPAGSQPTCPGSQSA
ncbi:hypothetical protein ACQCSU_13720 [Pseudarthrobacter sp. O4]|uniref:hypothetical protein n=1 Tax=Pseudarthrobacter sp. O4 TaxID=3418417 RepID=UPI003CEFB846